MPGLFDLERTAPKKAGTILIAEVCPGRIASEIEKESLWLVDADGLGNKFVQGANGAGCVTIDLGSAASFAGGN